MGPKFSMNKRQNLSINQISQNKEHIQLIWLDENINHTPDCLVTQSMLVQLNPAVHFYTDFNRCLRLIKSIKTEQIFLIVSGSLVRRLLFNVHNHRSLAAIFIFCSNRQHHESLLNDYSKIIGIYTDQKILLESIREKMNSIEKQTLAFNLFDQKQKSMKDLSKESASFLWNQMLIYVLKQIPQDEHSKQQMIELCQDYYQNNQKELQKIETFRNSYESNQAIQWYTDEGFLYKLLNKALRTEDVELLYTFRSFIIDLCTAIENENQHLKDEGILKLYRGTQIPAEELEKLKENIGQIISTNGFLSTSRNRNVSIRFARSNHLNKNLQGVLFEIQVDPSIKSISFADVKHQSLIEGEEEILFNLTSLFKIHSIDFDKTLQLWKIQLNTTDEGTEKVEQHLQLAKHEMEDYSPMIYFGRLLLNQLGQVDQARKYFEMLLKSLPSDHPDVGSVYNNIGNVYDMKGELNLALQNYQIGYELRRKQFSSDHPQIAGSLNNIGLIYRRKGNYDLALDYYQQALKMRGNLSSDENLHKAAVIENIGLVHMDKDNFDKALNHLYSALEIYKRLLPDPHAYIAQCLGEIGLIYQKKGHPDVAIDHYHQQLTMGEQCSPLDHPSLFNCLHRIVDTYEKMNQIEKGLEFCREKLFDQKNRLGENHRCIARTLMIMGEVLENHNSNEALKTYEKALSILENCSSIDYETTSECLISIAHLCLNTGLVEQGLELAQTALDYNRRIFSSNNIVIAQNLTTIAKFYKQMKNSSKAFEYYNESLLIYRINYESEHRTVKEVEADIARLKKILNNQ